MSAKYFTYFFTSLFTKRGLTLIPLALVLVFLLMDVIISLYGAIPGIKNGMKGGKNGFDLTNTSVPSAQILHGGPARDGIRR